MADDTSSALVNPSINNVRTPESEERWRQWEERGRQKDARFARKARVVGGILAGVAAAAAVIALLLV
ncbi:MAG TPA: hypothetical protein VGD94_15670 [Vicinamibacterales bacterium]